MSEDVIQTVITIPSLPPRIQGRIPIECQCCKKLQCVVDFPEINVNVYKFKCRYYLERQESCEYYEAEVSLF